MEGNQVGGIDARDESPGIAYRRGYWEKLPAQLVAKRVNVVLILFT
jgi:hypothetical protein